MFDFINIFSNKSSHPLARESSVTEILTELPGEDPAGALEELTHWLTALSNAESIKLKERVKRLARIDQSGQKYERRLRRQYIESSRMHKVTEERIWNASSSFLEATINAHLRCITHLPYKNDDNDQEMAKIVMRTFRRLDLAVHWLYLRYRPIPQFLWEQIFLLIKIAEERSLLQRPVMLNSATQLQTTAAQEMLKLLMLSVAAPEHLTKTQIDLARLLTHNLAANYRWENIPDRSTVFHVDFSKPRTPTRLTQTTEHHFLSRCFGSGEAVHALISGLKQLESGGVPTPLGNIAYETYKRADLLEVMAHLAQRWSKTQALNESQHFDKRHAERKQAFYRINVVHNFNSLYDQLVRPEQAEPIRVKELGARVDSIDYHEQVDMQIYGFITEKTRARAQQTPSIKILPTKPILSAKKTDEAESWVVENISQMGYGVTIENLKEDWVQAETLVGIQPDAGAWKIGVIRRLTSESVENTQVGIQILSNQPDAAMLHPADAEMSIWETAADTQTYHHTPGIVMRREPPFQEEETLLLAAGSYQLHRSYKMLVGEHNRSIRLLDRLYTFQGVDQLLFTDVKTKP